MKKLYLFGVLLVSGILLQSCEVEELTNEDAFDANAVEVAPSISVQEMASWDIFFVENAVPVNDYMVVFNGSTKEVINGVTYTTFTYTVGGTGVTAQLDSFYLEVPACAADLSSWTPSQSAKYEGNRLKWNSSISKDGSQEFSMTYRGDVDFGVIEAIVVRGGVEYAADVIGPCAGAYNLTGSVFVDANEDGTRQPAELGLAGFTVALTQQNNNAEVITDADGSYSFRVIPGDYTVSIGNNPLGNEYYTLNSPSEIPLAVPDDLEADFAFKALASKMTQDFNDKVILLNTISAKEWEQQIRRAGKKNGIFSKAEINQLLIRVEDLLLQDPYPFNLGSNRVNVALEILGKPIQTDEDLFLQQLLAAELNYLSGRGAYYYAADGSIVLMEDFNLTLLKYAEAQALGEPAVSAQLFSATAVSSSTLKLSSTSTLLSSFNDNGSGGL